MEYLFDQDKPYFAAWLQLHDIDNPGASGSTFWHITSSTKSKSDSTPLYYAALCGFQDLVEHVIDKNPSHVNARSGYYLTPLIAALAARHFQTAETLRDNGAHPNVSGIIGRTPLHSAAYYGEIEMVQVLLKYDADVHARTNDGGTPLHFASKGYWEGPEISLSLSNIARLLLEHGADVNAHGAAYSTPVHEAAHYGRVEVLRVLLEHVANLGVGEDDRKPANHVMSEYVNARDSKDKTPLHWASEGPYYEGGLIIGLPLSNIARLLLELGADVNARENDQSSPLHVAARHGRVEVVRVLLEHGANLGAENDDGKTALHVASENGRHKVMKLLSEHGAR
jgi:ankyrin repeat protein